MIVQNDSTSTREMCYDFTIVLKVVQDMDRGTEVRKYSFLLYHDSFV